MQVEQRKSRFITELAPRLAAEFLPGHGEHYRVVEVISNRIVGLGTGVAGGDHMQASMAFCDEVGT